MPTTESTPNSFFRAASIRSSSAVFCDASVASSARQPLLSCCVLTVGVDDADHGHVVCELGQCVGLVDGFEELGHVLAAVLEQDADAAGLVSAGCPLL